MMCHELCSMEGQRKRGEGKERKKMGLVCGRRGGEDGIRQRQQHLHHPRDQLTEMDVLFLD